MYPDIGESTSATVASSPRSVVAFDCCAQRGKRPQHHDHPSDPRREGAREWHDERSSVVEAAGRVRRSGVDGGYAPLHSDEHDGSNDPKAADRDEVLQLRTRMVVTSEAMVRIPLLGRWADLISCRYGWRSGRVRGVSTGRAARDLRALCPGWRS